MKPSEAYRLWKATRFTVWPSVTGDTLLDKQIAEKAAREKPAEPTRHDAQPESAFKAMRSGGWNPAV